MNSEVFEKIMKLPLPLIVNKEISQDSILDELRISIPEIPETPGENIQEDEEIYSGVLISKW